VTESGYELIVLLADPTLFLVVLITVTGAAFALAQAALAKNTAANRGVICRV